MRRVLVAALAFAALLPALAAAETRVAAVRPASASAFADVLTSPDPRRRKPGANLAAQIDRSRSEAILNDFSPTIAIPRTRPPALARSRATPARAARPHLALTSHRPAAAATSRIPVAGEVGVTAKIHAAYLPGLHRCARGSTLTLMFTIDPAGRVKRPTVAGVPAAVGSCIRKRMATWRFEAADRAAMVMLRLALAHR